MLKGYKDIFIEYFNIILFTLVVGLILAVMTVVIQVSDNKTFVTYAGNIVSRYGGLTPDAIEEIESHSKDYYRNKYKVVDGTKDIQDYGGHIDFNLKGKFKMYFFELPFEIDLKGSAISRVRTEWVE